MRFLTIKLFTLLLVFLVACAPPRGRYSSRETTRTTKTETQKQTSEKTKTAAAMETRTGEANKERAQADVLYSDTTYVDIETETEKEPLSFFLQFKKAESRFEAGLYDVCDKMKIFADIFADGDSLQFEAMFLQAECALINNEFEKGKELLLLIKNDERTPNSVKEKILVRLGHVCCVMDRKAEAQKYFNKLREEYPSSEFIKLANCEALNIE